jgi:hypothetical protein
LREYAFRIDSSGDLGDEKVGDLSRLRSAICCSFCLIVDQRLDQRISQRKPLFCKRLRSNTHIVDQKIEDEANTARDRALSAAERCLGQACETLNRRPNRLAAG